MPTIQQLPPAASVSSDDEIPISQGGVARSAAIGTLLAGTQPAIVAPTGSLMGRVSAGSGGPESITIGPGLTLNAGTLATTGIETAPQTSTIVANDLVCINRSGSVQTITYAQFLDGQTIDAAQPARPASDTDTFWVAQGSNLMLSQTFSAIWTWLAGKLPAYKIPVVEITVDTTLDGTVHNARLLVCSQPVTLSPAFTNMGSGFACEVLNLSTGAVAFGPGVSTTTGSPILPSGQSALVRAVSYSAGSVIFASIFGTSQSTSTSVPLPGSVVTLTTSSVTSDSVDLSWSSPTSGGAVSAYMVQYRVSGTGSWSTASISVVANSFVVTGLTSGTSYDFEVTATGSGGIGPAAIISATTSAAASSGSSGAGGSGSGTSGTGSSGSVTSITWNVVPSGSYSAGSGSLGVNAHVNPSSAPVQFGFSTSAITAPSSWTAAILVNTDLWGAYVPTPATAGTWYLWGEGLDGSSPTAAPTPITVT